MMANFENENNIEWKKELRSGIITALTENQVERNIVYAQIGLDYLCSTPKFLYKYYSNTTLNFETVQNNKMWYSAPCKFNDPFDCDIFINNDELFNSSLQLLPNNEKIKKGSFKYRELKKMVNKEILKLRAYFEKAKSKMGVACLSELDDSLLMWAHYANNHCGMCIEYEFLPIYNELNFIPIPVIYSDDKAYFSSLDEQTSREHTAKVLIESLTSKSPEWSYENEWRIVRDDTSCGDKWNEKEKGALLDMISPSSIILGCQAPTEFESQVKEHCKISKINLYKMEKDKDKYQLNRKPILEF